MGLSLLLLPLLLPLLPLLLPLLPLPASLQAGGSANCRSNLLYDIYQPKYLSAPEGGSIHIPFSFCYGWEPAQDPRVSIAWRWKEFHGPFIYNTTMPFIPEDFKGRLFLNWTKGQREGYLQISNLRREDESVYFCRVQVTTLTEGRKLWQSLLGTKLTVTRATTKTIEGPTITSTSTSTDGPSVSGDERSFRSWPFSMEAVLGVAMTITVLKIAILGLTVYFRWKKSKGQHRDSKRDSKVDGIVYASLGLSSSALPLALLCHPPHKTRRKRFYILEASGVGVNDALLRVSCTEGLLLLIIIPPDTFDSEASRGKSPPKT